MPDQDPVTRPNAALEGPHRLERRLCEGGTSRLSRLLANVPGGMPEIARSFGGRGRALLLVVLLTAGGCADAVGPELGRHAEPVLPPDVVRGIYVNAHAAGSPTRLEDLLSLVGGTSVNTFVIDVKEGGQVSYASAVPLVEEIGSSWGYIDDLPALMRTLREHRIYTIARIVCFRDAVLAQAKPEWAIHTTDGRLWLDPESGLPWVDPYNAEVWAYNIDLAREALSAGFAEIQWDYVRFPDVNDSIRATMVFPAQRGRSAGEAIEEFIAASRSGLAAFGAPITADVFGRVITGPGDDGIGQDWNRLVRVTDVLLPMVYPALYEPGNFGAPDPNAEPYLIVRAAINSAVARLERTAAATATIRPWLQAFTQGNTVYGSDEMHAQMQAVADAGLKEWLFWNPESAYPAGVFD
jgi:hypothetical protein